MIIMFGFYNIGLFSASLLLLCGRVGGGTLDSVRLLKFWKGFIMSLDPRFNKHHSVKTVEVLQNLDSLESVAAAAGHGYMRRDLNAGWTQVEFDDENVRPTYDLRYIRTFSPQVVQALLFELSESRKALSGARVLVEQLVDASGDGGLESLEVFDSLVANIPTL